MNQAQMNQAQEPDNRTDSRYLAQAIELQILGFVKKGVVRTVGLIPVVALLMASIGLALISFGLPDDSFSQQLFVNLAAGVTTLLAAPFVVRWGLKSRRQTFWGGMLLSISCCVLAFFSSGAFRALLTQAAVVVGLLLAVEIYFRRWKEGIERESRRIETEGGKT